MRMTLTMIMLIVRTLVMVAREHKSSVPDSSFSVELG